MSEPINGFAIRAADNSGKCYASKKVIKAMQDGKVVVDLEQPIIDGVKAFLDTIEDLETDKQYYEDPVLTFENSILTGCYLDMNRDEFTKFCNYESLYLNTALIQNMYNLDYIGKYGNSNPHLKSDWVEVTKSHKAVVKPQSGDKSFGKAKLHDEKCTLENGFPTLNIYYKKIGRVEDPQRIILSAEVRYDRKNEWKYVQPDPAMKQRFYLGAAVEFHEAPEETEMFLPTSEFWSLFSLSKNALYPFFVVGGQDEEVA